MTKEQKRAAKQARARPLGSLPNQLDVACVIHGSTYDWQYVEKLYNQVTRYSSVPVTFHVWTEHDRSVPPHMVKHVLEPWPGIAGPRKAWWYKMQLFDTRHHLGDLLYFDLDVILLRSIDWIVEQPTDKFCTIRDFRYLQQRANVTMNSSIMWWNTARYHWIWEGFLEHDIERIAGKYHGDQDYLNAVIPASQKFYYADQLVTSYRWQALDGGFDFRTRRHRAPGAGVQVSQGVGAMIFHGRPKPHMLHQDKFVQTHWC